MLFSASDVPYCYIKSAESGEWKHFGLWNTINLTPILACPKAHLPCMVRPPCENLSVLILTPSYFP
jgi:hypothetical protein